jgi:hypothetical protein
MNPPLFLYVLLALPLFAQTSNWHGMKTGPVQLVDLVASGGPPTQSVQFETWVEQLPRDHAESVTTTFSKVQQNAGRVTVGRVIRDNFRKIEVIYSLTVELEPNAQTFRAIFENSPPEYGPVTPGWTILSPPIHPVPQTVRKGELLKLVLYARPTGAKMVEYIRIAEPGRQPLREDTARDAYAENAEFNIANPRLRVNGETRAMASVAELHGGLLRVRIPRFGTYVLSLRARPGLDFENAGEVSGNSLMFMARGNLFRIDCSERIAAGSAAYNVYALPEPLGESADSEATVEIESALESGSGK